MKKAVLFFLTTATVLTAQARIGLESHYGKLTTWGFEATCTFQNKTQEALDMKYVVFALETTPSGNSYYEDYTIRIDRVVRSGETVSFTTLTPAFREAKYCRFMAR